jgi:hypothetical protein
MVGAWNCVISNRSLPIAALAVSPAVRMLDAEHSRVLALADHQGHRGVREG